MLKKAVSPLIATVLLVAMTISVGMMVMRFQEGTTLEFKERATRQIDKNLKCSLDISLKIVDVSNEELICYNRTGSSNLEVVVENQGSVDIEGVRIFLLDFNNNIKTADALTVLGGHNRTKYNISIATLDDGSNFTFPPTKVIISPILDYSADSVNICSDSELEVEDLDQC